MRLFVLFAVLGLVHADQTAYEAGMAKVIESLDQVVIPGNNQYAGDALGRKLYVSHLLRSAERLDPNEPMSAAAITAIEGAITILQGIKTTMEGDTTRIQAELDDIATNYQECVTEYGTFNTTIHTGSGGDALVTVHANAQTAHSDCRDAEEILQTASDTDCSSFQTAITAEVSSIHMVCLTTFPQFWVIEDIVGDGAAPTHPHDDHHATVLASWASWFAAQDSHFTTTTIDTKADDCLLAYNTWAAKNGRDGASTAGNCQLAQTAFEDARCNLRIRYHEQCQSEQWCLAYWHTRYDTHRSTTLVDSDRRIQDCALLSYVICLLEDLSQDANNSNAADWEDSCSTTHLNVPYPTCTNTHATLPVDSHPACESMAWYTAVAPYDAGWYAHLLTLNPTFTGPYHTIETAICDVNIDWTDARADGAYSITHHA